MKTAEEILREKGVLSSCRCEKCIEASNPIIEAMEEYAAQFKTGIDDIISRYAVLGWPTTIEGIMKLREEIKSYEPFLKKTIMTPEEEVEKKVKEYAKIEAIMFADWILENAYVVGESFCLHEAMSGERYSSEQIYELFKKQSLKH